MSCSAADVPVPPGFALVGRGARRSPLSDRRGVGSPRSPPRSVPDAVGSDAEPVMHELARTRRERLEPPVAVRSSAVGEDSAEATFAGQQETYLWVRGADAVVRRGRAAAGRACTARRRSATAPSSATTAAPGDGRRRAADGRRRGLGVMFTLQPGQRRPEHGRDQRQLGPRPGGRRRRRHAR